MSLISVIFIACAPLEKTEQTEKLAEEQTKSSSILPDKNKPDGLYDIEQSGLSAIFFPVGKGDCIIVQCEGQTMLIDAGYEYSARDILSYLDEQNITTLSAVIATHPDKDHIGGFPKIIESKINIDVLYKTDAGKNNNYAYDSFISALKKYNINTVNPEIGSSFELGDAVITFLSPQPTKIDSYKDINDTSIVVKIQYANQSILLTGDMRKNAEKDLLDYISKTDFDLSSTILKVGHHGSSEASTKKFIEAVNPLYAVITCDVKENGKHSLSDKIAERLEEAGASLLRTDTDGLININITQNGEINIKTGTNQ